MYKDLKIYAKPFKELTEDDFNPLKGDRVVNLWKPRLEDLELIEKISKGVVQKEKPFFVDAGCRSGFVSWLLSIYGNQVLAIDKDKNLISEAKKAYKHKDLEFLEGDVEKLEEILQSRKIKEIDAIYCSFMKKGQNWTDIFRKLNPKVIIDVLEYDQNGGYTTGCKEAYEPSKDYFVYATWPVISYQELYNLEQYSLEETKKMMRAFVSIEIKKDLKDDLISRIGTVRELQEKIILKKNIVQRMMD